MPQLSDLCSQLLAHQSLHYSLSSLPPQPDLTQPFTAVQLHSHADVHGVVCDGHEADEASDDGRLEVLEHDVVGVPVSFNHLQVKQTHPDVMKKLADD